MTTASEQSASGLAAYGPAAFGADKEVLSLALIEARNTTLALIPVFETAGGEPDVRSDCAHWFDPPRWIFGHIAWYAEWWCLRWDIQAPQPLRAPWLEGADALFDARHIAARERWQRTLPDWATLRRYLAESLEQQLDNLAACDGSDAALYLYRMCLAREDGWSETLHALAQCIGLPEQPVLRLASAAVARRPPLLCPAGRYLVGAPRAAGAAGGGRGWQGPYVPDNEQWQHEVQVPEFEIDAQPVSWGEYVEFIQDGGYDRPELWSRDGRLWLDATQQRVPAYVEQARHSVLARRYARTLRIALGEPVRHVCLYEAEAYARWAGRRLPTEVEWEVAAQHAARRGFGWGQVLEWTASAFRPYPGFAPGPDAQASEPYFERCQALRGASFACAPRLRRAGRRSFAEAPRREGFTGFRTCAP